MTDEALPPDFEAMASRVMAECVAKSGGENVAFYLAQALRQTHNAALEAAAAYADNKYEQLRYEDVGAETAKQIAKEIRALQVEE